MSSVSVSSSSVEVTPPVDIESKSSIRSKSDDELRALEDDPSASDSDKKAAATELHRRELTAQEDNAV